MTLLHGRSCLRFALDNKRRLGHVQTKSLRFTAHTPCLLHGQPRMAQICTTQYFVCVPHMALCNEPASMLHGPLLRDPARGFLLDMVGQNLVCGYFLYPIIFYCVEYRSLPDRILRHVKSQHCA